MLAPLTDLVGECGHTKITKKKGTKKQPWYWSDMHQKAFDAIKQVLDQWGKDVAEIQGDYQAGSDNERLEALLELVKHQHEY